MKNKLIALDELVEQADGDAGVVEGALRSLTTMGNVAWFGDNSELRQYVFVRPEWMLALIFLMFYVKHLDRVRVDEKKKRKVAELRSFPLKAISSDERASLLCGRVPYMLGEV